MIQIDFKFSYNRYMKVGFNRVPSPDMFHLLMQNPKGELADQVLSERFPELKDKVC